MKNNYVEELKIEIGLDSGGGFLKLLMTIDQQQSEKLELGAGEFGLPIVKKKKLGHKL